MHRFLFEKMKTLIESDVRYVQQETFPLRIIHRQNVLEHMYIHLKIVVSCEIFTVSIADVQHECRHVFFCFIFFALYNIINLVGYFKLWEITKLFWYKNKKLDFL